MTLTQFILTYNGKKVDYDHQHGPQCVDLVRQYFHDVLMIPQPPSVTGAVEMINKPGMLKVTPDGVLADYSKGDILVWGTTDKNPYGHVAILVAVYNTKYFIVFEQDGFKQDGAKLAFRSRENLLGCLHK